MKKFTVFFAFILVILFNCQDPKQSINENRVSPFHRNVGKQISTEVANRWIGLYKNSNNSQRTENAPHVTAASFDAILNPISDKIGVSFHRAIDNDGGYHILAVPVKDGSSLWEHESILDASRNILISAEIAKTWAARYKSENPQGVWSHFFGSHVFLQEFTSVDLADAVNDEGAAQLLLFIWRSSNSNGRSQGQTLEVFDASAPCPPTCNGSEV